MTRSSGAQGWPPRQKPSRRGSVLANEIRGVSRMHQGGCHEVAERGVEVVGGHDRAACKGGGLVVHKKTENRALVARFSLTTSEGLVVG